MSVEYTGAGGVRKQYGPRDVEDVVPGKHSTGGEVQELTVTFNYDNLPSVQNAGKDATNSYIPANSLVHDATFYETEAFTSASGTTTVDVGTEKADGSDVDSDGIFTGVVTADGSAGGWSVAGGAQVGATVGTDDAYILVSSSADDLTAGKGKLVVRYQRNV